MILFLCRFSVFAKTMKKKKRDVTKEYPRTKFVAKLRRLADAVEGNEKFTIQVAGERLYIPRDATVNIEHERSGDQQELEFQVTWKN